MIKNAAGDATNESSGTCYNPMLVHRVFWAHFLWTKKQSNDVQADGP